jgi:hypothetical protein
MRHLLARTLFENFFLFFSLGMILLFFAMVNTHASFALTLALLVGTPGINFSFVSQSSDQRDESRQEYFADSLANFRTGGNCPQFASQLRKLRDQ